MSSGRLIDPQLRKYALDHVLRVLGETKVQEDPFPHFVVRGFLPDDVYSQLLTCLPESSQYTPFSYDGTKASGRAHRMRFSLVQDDLGKLSRENQTFWCSVRSVIGSIAVKERVFDMLRDGLAIRFGCKPNETSTKPGFAVPDLYRETENYCITPHPDTRKKLVTMQMSLAQDESQVAMGTEFYRRSFRPNAWMTDPKGFEIVKTMPFLPNTTYAFSVLNTIRIKSWHGRSSLPSQCGVRNSLLNIWYCKADQGNQELIAENESINAMRSAA